MASVRRRNIVTYQALPNRTSRRKAFTTLKNRGHHGNQRKQPDCRDTDRGTPGRAWPVGAFSACDLDRTGGPDPWGDLVCVLPELNAPTVSDLPSCTRRTKIKGLAVRRRVLFSVQTIYRASRPRQPCRLREQRRGVSSGAGPASGDLPRRGGFPRRRPVSRKYNIPGLTPF